MEEGVRLVAELDPLLSGQLDAGRSLLELLEAESEALASRDAEALARVTALKGQAIERLEALERQRRAFCLRIGAGPGHAEMEAWLVAYAGGDAEMGLARRWHALTATLRQCRTLNQTNGQVVASLQRRVQQALGLLRGGGSEGGTYSPGGLPQGLPTARAFVRA